MRSRSISRVLSWTVIYLDGGLLPPLKPLFVAHRANVQPHLALLQIGFTGFRRSRETGELLPRLSTLTAKAVPKGTLKSKTSFAAVYLCCTFPKVTLGGRQPLFCPVGLGLSSDISIRNRLTDSVNNFNTNCALCQTLYFFIKYQCLEMILWKKL